MSSIYATWKTDQFNPLRSTDCASDVGVFIHIVGLWEVSWKNVAQLVAEFVQCGLALNPVLYLWCKCLCNCLEEKCFELTL